MPLESLDFDEVQDVPPEWSKSVAEMQGECRVAWRLSVFVGIFYRDAKVDSSIGDFL